MCQIINVCVYVLCPAGSFVMVGPVAGLEFWSSLSLASEHVQSKTSEIIAWVMC